MILVCLILNCKSPRTLQVTDNELDNVRIPTFTQIQQFAHSIYAMKRFLGLTDEEVAENERLWREENDENLQPFPTDAPGEMRGVGNVAQA